MKARTKEYLYAIRDVTMLAVLPCLAEAADQTHRPFWRILMLADMAGLMVLYVYYMYQHRQRQKQAHEQDKTS